MAKKQKSPEAEEPTPKLDSAAARLAKMRTKNILGGTLWIRAWTGKEFIVPTASSAINLNSLPPSLSKRLISAGRVPTFPTEWDTCIFIVMLTNHLIKHAKSYPGGSLCKFNNYIQNFNKLVCSMAGYGMVWNSDRSQNPAVGLQDLNWYENGCGRSVYHCYLKIVLT